MSDGINEINFSLAERIARHARRSRTPHALLEYALEEVIKTCSGRGGIFFLVDNAGINPAKFEKGKSLKLSTEIVSYVSQNLPHNYSPPIPIFFDEPIKNNSSKIHEKINQELSDLLKLTNCNSCSFFMLFKEDVQGIVYVFHDKEITTIEGIRQLIEDSLSEVTMMLEIISDGWHLHQSLIKFNEIGLTLQGSLLSNFVEQMLSKAKEFIGCSGLSFFLEEPSIDRHKFILAGTYPRKKPEDKIIYYTDEDYFTSKILNLKQPCTVHYSKLHRNQIDTLLESKWRDIDGVSLSVMYIPIKDGDNVIGLLRCTNESNMNLNRFFNLIDIHFAEIFSSLMFSWLLTARKQEQYSFALLDIAHEIKLIVAGIKSAAQFVINEIEKPKNPDSEKIFKLSHIRHSADSLRELLPVLLRSQGIVKGTDDAMIEHSFLPYADLCKPIAEIYREATKKRKVNIVIQGTDQIGRIYANIEDFRHILQNLINNAVKYTYEGNDIIIKMQRATGKYAMIHVMSKSIPVEPNEREEIFKGNYRSINVVKAKIEGEGRGLKIARSIARRLGGDIVLNIADGYNIFTIFIPVELFRSKRDIQV